MKKSSNLDALLEALKKTGMDIGDQFSGTGGGDFSGGSRYESQGFDSDSQRKEEDYRVPRSGGGSGHSGGKGPHFDLDELFSKGAPMTKKRKIITIILVVLIVLALYWWFHPPINIHSSETWTFIIIVILLPTFLLFRNRSRNFETGTSKIDPDAEKSKRYKHFSWIPLGVFLLFLVGVVMSYSFFPGNAEKYANILQTTELDFASDIPEVDYNQIPVIDHDSAELLGNREMGSIPEYVSQFEISSLYSQINYQGKPVRVSPLGYADLFKWWINRDTGLPAYALVNMTTQDAEVVRLGDHPMYFSESEPLERNIQRYVQLKYPFYMFDEFSFEIDEEGNPWWICPVQDRTIGLFGGTTIQRVVMCNATTGECQDLDIHDVPQWVDRAYPSDLLIQQYNWSGRYKNGWLNSWLGQSGVVQTTPGTNGSLGYNYIAKDDDVWVYTGVTSATADNSIVGFVLVNQRTAESHYYPVAGATEESAMQSAEGQVQNLRYTATFPLLINVANQPTYFMALKDDAGLVKKFAMIDIQRYQNVAVGDTVADTQKSYEALLATNGVISSNDISLGENEASGKIRTMAQAVIDGNTHYYVTLEGDSRIYDFALPGFIKICSYKVGDKITVTYVDGNPAASVSTLNGEAAVSTDSNTSAASGDQGNQNADQGGQTSG
ncbi:MAG: Tat pathway signal sequence [Eggerthellaceae bacterium]